MWKIALALVLLLAPPPVVLDAAHRAAHTSPLPEGEDATVAMLLAIGQHESGFRDSVRTCAKLGDGGLAYGTYQLHERAMGNYTTEDVCRNDYVQAWLAIGVLRRARRMWPELGLEGAVRAYASGTAKRDSKAAREIWDLYLRRLQTADHRLQVLSPDPAL